MDDSSRRRQRFVLPTTITTLVCVGVAGFGSELQTREAHPIRVQLANIIHHHSEAVRFDIVNGSDQAVHYRFGCNRPLIYRLEEDGEVELTTNTDDSVPDVRTLLPGETDACRWNQRAWQDPDRRGRARFQHFDVLVPVPAGRYQIEVQYFLDRDDADADENAHSARSEPFTIR